MGVPERYEIRIHQTDDGSLSYPLAERLALMMADGVADTDAWRILGKENNSSGGRTRRAVLAHPVFKLRLEELMAEKAESEKDEVWGEPRWMAQQLWREARATGDLPLAQKAAEMRLRIAEKSQAEKPPPAPAEEGEKVKGKVGAPAVEQPRSGDVDDLKRRLAEKGIHVAAPPIGGDEEDAAA